MANGVSSGTIVTPVGPLIVRGAQASDLDVVFEILEEAEAWLTSKGIDQWTPGVHRQYAQRFADAIDQGFVFVAGRRDGQIAAVVVLSWSGGKLWPAPQDDAGYVSKLAVRRDLSGHGVGLALLRWAERLAISVGKKYVRLDCLAGNHRLCQYYVDAGYRPKGEVDAHGYRLRLYERCVPSGFGTSP
jgi:GNAT superfamily N-acetyltransferase